ncbi:MAG: ATP-grasp domain-containing protein [Levilactobacillus sp.]|uniref:carbamoyl phosphate synthase preATP-grasp domain-containing protein n=1 Tax=Levilactobacillus sp. TaxID=2767919 RepID=UPI002583D6F9|nr:ATP-grasp domain-containing protein [Levilactobacillus sp.]MCH4123371.1 ATP-grasp domain-containing protein [Levilactobacillus sp.]MCI1552491.1 ATP-grasp domain-containing protein [Levilactobacillus sp.]MCI1606324.1 ATP-grasp domain-containing protein [Levilactobacillus sp.]
MPNLNDIQKVLIIGGGPTEIGHETELDSATVQIITEFKKHGVRTLIIDNNPFSVALEEIQPTNMYVQAVTTANVRHIIEKDQPDAILPSLGGLLGIRIAQELIENGDIGRYGITILGMPASTLRQINNPAALNTTLKEIHEPVIEAQIVATVDEAMGLVDTIGFPLIVKPVAPRLDTNRTICENVDDMVTALNQGFQQSRFDQCTLERSVVGYKEIEMVAVRDGAGTAVLISGLENVDPIGIHSGDSIVVAPPQTLNDREYQDLRDVTFRIAAELSIVGVLHLHFALNPDNQHFYVTKIAPYFSRGVALAARTSGYPIALVTGALLLGQRLVDVKLPSRFTKQTAIMEPTIDHVSVRIPLWPFQEVPDADQHLDTVMKAVGSTVGIGRSVEEAMLKSVRSSQFSPRDVLPSVSNLSDGEMIRQLIHPLANRILVLIEALRRGYAPDELSELTKIDNYYFVKLRHLLTIEEQIQSHPLDVDVLQRARYFGFGDGMIARIWQTDTAAIRQLSASAKIMPTYKMIEPTAGEFPEDLSGYYSTFEYENESQPLGDRTALVLGRGGNQLGPNSAAEYFTTEMLKQLKRAGYHTILMNTNPNAVGVAPEFSDKQYVDPIQLGDVLNVIQVEHPDIVIVPGNRHYLTRELGKLDDVNLHVLPPDQETGEPSPKMATIGVSLFVHGQQKVAVGVMDMIAPGMNKALSQVTAFRMPAELPKAKRNNLVEAAKQAVSERQVTGMIQVLFAPKSADSAQLKVVGVRPTRLTEMAFLSKVTGVNWVRMLTRQHIGTLDDDELAKITIDINSNRVALMNAAFPFRQLHVLNRPGSTDQEVGATIAFGSSEALTLTNLSDTAELDQIINRTI